MTDRKNPIAKTEAYVEKHGLENLVTLGDNNIIKVTDDILEAVACMDAGLTLDQANRLAKAKGDLINGVTFVGGKLAAQAFKDTESLNETGFNFTMGSATKVSGMFSRDAKDAVVVAVETTHRSAEFNRVASHLKGLFDDINS
mgnify:FL=1